MYTTTHAPGASRARRHRHRLSAAGAIVAAAALALTGPLTATAADLGPIIPTLDPGSGQITITKINNSVPPIIPADITRDTITGDGTPIDPEDLAPLGGPLAGATFTITTVSGGIADEFHTGLPGSVGALAEIIDLIAEFNAADPTRQAELLADFDLDLDNVLTLGPTGINGVVETDPNLPFGLYLIHESITPNGATGSRDSLIALPFSRTDDTLGNVWENHAYIYPKNKILGPSKTVVDADVRLGNDRDSYVAVPAEWTIAGPILDPGDGPFIGFTLIDPLAPELLFQGTTTMTARIVDASNIPVENIDELTIGTTTSDADLIVTWSDETESRPFDGINWGEAPTDPSGSDIGGGTLKIDVVNPTTLAILDDYFGGKLEVTFQTKAAPQGGNPLGVVSNTVYHWSNGYDVDVPPGSSFAQERFGGVLFGKVDSSEVPQLITQLGDTIATFDLYATTAGEDFDLDTAGDPIGTYQVDPNGFMLIENLRLSGYADGEELKDTDPRYVTYWLVETVAPDGYSLLPAPYPFIVVQTAKTVPESGTGTPADADLLIVNAPALQLPLTGAAGIGIIAGFGVLLVGGGVMVALSMRRRARRVQPEAAALA